MNVSSCWREKMFFCVCISANREIAMKENREKEINEINDVKDEQNRFAGLRKSDAERKRVEELEQE